MWQAVADLQGLMQLEVDEDLVVFFAMNTQIIRLF